MVLLGMKVVLDHGTSRSQEISAKRTLEPIAQIVEGSKLSKENPDHTTRADGKPTHFMHDLPLV